MARDIGDYSAVELANLIENHRRQGHTQAPLYLAALSESERRRGRGLSFDTTLRSIRAAAARRQFISYKTIAEESGTVWAKVHWQIGDHLTRLCEYAHRQGWPLLSAIVVNADNVGTGKLDPQSLAGFIAMARSLGRVVTDETDFLKAEQQRVFEWALGETGRRDEVAHASLSGFLPADRG